MGDDLQREQKPIDEAIVGAILESIPPEWKGAFLTLERSDRSANVGEFSHTLASLDGRTPAFPADSLFDQTLKLDELFRRYSALLVLVTYRVEQRDDGTWNYVAEYKHEKQAA